MSNQVPCNVIYKLRV